MERGTQDDSTLDALATAIIEVLRGCRRATAKEITRELAGRGLRVDKRAINPRLYTLASRGLLTRVDGTPPVWSLMDHEEEEGVLEPTAEPACRDESPSVDDETSGHPATLTWLPEQKNIVEAPFDARLLVEAGPGTGKTAVACARVAYLLNEGHTPGCIHLVSFTRTAVAELRDRIVAAVGDEAKARSVQISTLDSKAWTVLHGYAEEGAQTRGGYEQNIESTLQLLRSRKDEVTSFIERIEHIIIDEAQDLTGLRADLLLQFIRCLSPECGFTIFADPAQAIYGFTTDESDGAAGTKHFLDIIEEERFERRQLTKLFRTRSPALQRLNRETRALVPRKGNAGGGLTELKESILGAADERVKELATDALTDDTLVLFRRRVDAIEQSSVLSKKEVRHRLRLSALPVVVHPWIGWLFAEADAEQELQASDFSQLWKSRSVLAPALFDGIVPENALERLLRYARGRTGGIDLARLREVLARSAPPVEFCCPELGSKGPILGTIHASKGREANYVWVEVFKEEVRRDQPNVARRDELAREECRVNYVAATRARLRFGVIERAKPRGASSLPSGRAYRSISTIVQLEIGRFDDLDIAAQVSRAHYVDPRHVQRVQQWLATSPIGEKVVAKFSNGRYALSRETEAGCVGILSTGVMEDVREAMERRFATRTAPYFIPYLYLVAVGTAAISNEQWRERAHEPWSHSGFFLIPVIKGFVPLEQSKKERP